MNLDSNITLREYQKNIVKNILKKGNTLVVLPTGLGKTIIALKVMEYYLNQGKKCLFLAPTRPLVEQHKKTIEKLLGIKVMMITGIQKKDKRLNLYNNSVVVATPQVVKNDLGEIDINSFSLIIFDEAHRAVGNYAYVEIARKFNNHILALTASPSYDKDKIKEILKNLKIRHIEARTEEDEDVKKYIQETKIRWIRVSLPESFKALKALIDKLAEKEHTILREFGIKRKNFTRKELLEMQKRLFQKVNENPAYFSLISAISNLLRLDHLKIILFTQGIPATKKYLDKLKQEKQAKRIVENKYFDLVCKKVDEMFKEGYIHPKVPVLEKILYEYISKGKKAIVFNHYRDSVHTLEEFFKNNRLIKAKAFIGQAKRGNTKGLSQKEQIKVIELFRKGEINVLLATSVGEEGLDIPEVDLVVFYEPVPSEIRYIQRKGRTGRLKKGDVFILITKNTPDEAFYWSAKRKAYKMKKTIKNIKDELNKLKEKEERNPIQRKLTDFFQSGLEAPIVVDNREKNTKVVYFLQKLGANIYFFNLDIGDYLLSGGTVVERKTTNDFVNSLIDGRLFKQASLLSLYEKPVFLIEGGLYQNRISQNAFFAAVSSLFAKYNISFLVSPDAYSSARIIYYLAKKSREMEGKITLKKVKKEKENIPLEVLQCFPNIGEEKAKRLLSYFGSLKGVFSSSRVELSKVEGIGEKTAKDIWEIINKKWRD